MNRSASVGRPPRQYRGTSAICYGLSVLGFGFVIIIVTILNISDSYDKIVVELIRNTLIYLFTLGLFGGIVAEIMHRRSQTSKPV